MNIIINGEEIRYTPSGSILQPHDITTIKIYYAKNTEVAPTLTGVLTYVDGAGIQHLFPNLNIEIDLTTPEHVNYFIYKIKYDKQLYQRAYVLELNDGVNTYQCKDLIVTNDLLMDQHGSITVNANRTLTVPNDGIEVLAQDRKSQQISFLIDELYDGISRLDDSKKIYVDFIPPNYKPGVDDPAFFTSEINSKFIPADEAANGKIKLLWTIPPLATAEAGTVTFSLAVMSEDAEYIWQTKTGTFTVSPNIGLRNLVGSLSDDIIVPPIKVLADRIAALENSDIYNVDKDNPTNDEIIFSAGSSIEE